jgi:hypothetical protein
MLYNHAFQRKSASQSAIVETFYINSQFVKISQFYDSKCCVFTLFFFCKVTVSCAQIEALSKTVFLISF